MKEDQEEFGRQIYVAITITLLSESLVASTRTNPHILQSCIMSALEKGRRKGHEL